eukprot:7292877-Alexandrium_andersonii.AAC.1
MAESAAVLHPLEQPLSGAGRHCHAAWSTAWRATRAHNRVVPLFIKHRDPGPTLAFGKRPRATVPPA